MENKSFSILVPYKGKMVIANAAEIDNPLQLYYQVNFPDGSSTLFHNYEGDRGWAEAELDVTDLAKDIGPIIDMYRHKKYFEPFFLKVNETSYAVQPFTEDEGSTIKYEIYKMTCEHLMNILMSKGEWDYEQVSDDNTLEYESLAKEMGPSILNRQ
jgi:hypothetical protein